MSKEKIFVTRSSMPSYEEYIEAIKPLWETHRLTNMGIYHKQLEAELKEYLAVPGLSLMVNGHMALELAIQSFDFPEESEIITTPFTFISTTHAIVRNRLQPVFCDVKEEDGTIDESLIEELITPKTVAILPVHVYGHLCNVKAIKDIADKYNLRVIYDAAHAFGEKIDGIGIGNYGDASIFSFHATKVFNTIEGGAVVCKDEKMYTKLKDLKNFGIRGEELVASIGANSKMNEFCAIMGLLNIKTFDEAVIDRKRAYKRYQDRLRGNRRITFYESKENVKSNYGYLPIRLDSMGLRDEIYEHLKSNNIFTRKYFYPLTADQVCFKNKYKESKLPVARELSKRSLVLPLYERLKDEDIDRICELIIRKCEQ